MTGVVFSLDQTRVNSEDVGMEVTSSKRTRETAAGHMAAPHSSGPGHLTQA